MITAARTSIFLTSLLAAAVLAGCNLKWQPDRTGDPSDRAQDELDAIPQFPHVAVCSGGTYHCKSHVRTDTTGHVQTFATPSGFGATDLASAYSLNTALTPTATIAIVDAYDYPNAESDLGKYRSQYGLPACTTANGCFKKVNQNGAASPLPAASPSNDDWTIEAALDLDMASAACPHCKLILVEANDDQGNGLFVANNGAATLAPTVVSNSWGGPESGGEASEETYFTHAGIAYFVASGDNGENDGGAGPDYPSTSAHVTAVGGTSLVKSSNTRGWTEGAWSDGGSSCSNSIPKPSYQTSSVCGKRATSDVAAVADPNTGVAVYNAGSGGWTVVGGTSAASPFVAGVYALYGLGAQAPGWPYSHTADFFDVTTGKNGSCGTILCNAGAGWDGPTGVGTPNGTALGGGTCTPACSGKDCGDDGCGGSCGACSSGDTCSAGMCMGSGSGSGSGDSCSHPICSTGADLSSGCDPCATEVCARDGYCCNTAWDSVCVGEVSSICHETCGTGSTCSHSICTAGKKLTKTCDTCAGDICAEDSYCCTTKWDSQCVSEVSSICGESCN